MAYWWVNQKKSFPEESGGQLLWVPQPKVGDEAGTESDNWGRFPAHWAAINQISPGDIIFHHVKGEILAISVALAVAEESAVPQCLVDIQRARPDQTGLLLPTNYSILPTPFPIKRTVVEFAEFLSDKRGPFYSDGGLKMGYIFELGPRMGRVFFNRIEGHIGKDLDVWYRSDKTHPPVVLEQLASPPVTTERQALLKSRVGQGRFREGLVTLWGGKCAVTSSSIQRLLRASHCKPWKDSNNKERLDPFNGLLLSPQYDGAFDLGIISFDREGKVLISSTVNSKDLEVMGISPNAKLAQVFPRSLEYLQYHRDNVFEP